mmetsp:Transcript_114897/g.324749  ORF Transcript_114897/g.324749 Transcript_114897/m.324749 type:complete len:224 (-) Transcript_114897:216-887(-)
MWPGVALVPPVGRPTLPIAIHPAAPRSLDPCSASSGRDHQGRAVGNGLGGFGPHRPPWACTTLLGQCLPMLRRHCLRPDGTGSWLAATSTNSQQSRSHDKPPVPGVARPPRASQTRRASSSRWGASSRQQTATARQAHARREQVALQLSTSSQRKVYLGIVPRQGNQPTSATVHRPAQALPLSWNRFPLCLASSASATSGQCVCQACSPSSRTVPATSRSDVC